MFSLEDAPIVDVHCHPWRRDDLLGQSASAFLDRTTMMGMCQLTSGSEGSADTVAELTRSTVFALALRSRLAAVLGCADDTAEVGAKRELALSEEPGYLSSLFSGAGIAGIFCDEGYPQPPVDLPVLAEQVDTAVLRVGRIEPWIDELAANVETYEDLEDAFLERIRREAEDDLVAFKSVIAYRTGLDVGDPSRETAGRSFAKWRSEGSDRRSREKDVRDRLLRLTLEVARELDRPVHIHCGGGDPEIVLQHARPSDIFPLLSAHADQPIVLIHSGWPWIEEAAYVASILPNVYLDVSVMLPWASLAIDQKLEVLLGAAPASKVMYGSDEASEPEVVWFSALMGREAVERVLGRASEHDWLTPEQASAIGRGFLAGNAARLHGVESRLGAT